MASATRLLSSTVTGVLVLIGVLVVVAAVGLLRRRLDGRLRDVTSASGTTTASAAAASPELAALTEVGFEPGEAGVTLVQFSSAFCQPCRATRTILSEVAGTVAGVRHLEVDAESQLEAVRTLGILRTPTTLVVDSAGAIVQRASGQPRKADVIAAVGRVLLPTGASQVSKAETR